MSIPKFWKYGNTESFNRFLTKFLVLTKFAISGYLMNHFVDITALFNMRHWIL